MSEQWDQREVLTTDTNRYSTGFYGSYVPTVFKKIPNPRRDLFAAAALTGLLASKWVGYGQDTLETYAWQIADEMLRKE